MADSKVELIHSTTATPRSRSRGGAEGVVANVAFLLKFSAHRATRVARISIYSRCTYIRAAYGTMHQDGQTSYSVTSDSLCRWLK